MSDLEQTLAEFESHPNNPSPNNKRRRKKPRCATCKKKATCLGAYEGDKVETYACDECCGHAGEDGHCRLLKEPTP